MGEQSIASAINSLFKDAYASLEQVQEHADEIESFSDSIVGCHHAILNLERIHRIYSQNPGSTLAQDAFSLRNNLERFIGSCHALIRMLGLLSTTSDVGCWIGGGKAAVKRKHVRELQEEFWDHQRILSLVLANAVYMTTLDMQKENNVPDPELDAILRQAQKRHTVYEKTEKSGQEHKSQKPAETHVEQLEFSVCLRKYFDYIERQAKRQAEVQRRLSAPLPVQSNALVRYSNQSTASLQSQHDGQWNGLNRRKSLTYGNSMEGHSYNEIYTRPRRNSTASRPSSVGARSRNNSITSIQSLQTVVTTSAQQSPGLPTTPNWNGDSRPQNRRSSPSARPMSTEETISRAWNDITKAMQTMSLLEARAYIEGRLAGLDPSIISEIRQAMSATNLASPTFSTSLPNKSSPNLPSPTSMWGTTEPKAVQTRPRPRSYGPTPVIEATQSVPSIRMVPPPAPLDRASSEPTRPKPAKKHNLAKPKSNKRLSSIRNEHARQLSTIVERPSTAKSRGESTRSRKSVFSLKKEKPLPTPKKVDPPAMERKPSGGSNFSSDGSTLRGSTPEEPRIFDLEEVPEEPGPLPDIKSKKRSINSALASKPLPMTPGDLLQPEVATSPASSVKSRISKLFSPLSRRSMASLPSTLSSPSLASGMKSRETLGQMSNASLECLRKGGMNGSRSTLLVAYQEGPDQPFQVWLNALPYIEGRAGAKV